LIPKSSSRLEDAPDAKKLCAGYSVGTGLPFPSPLKRSFAVRIFSAVKNHAAALSLVNNHQWLTHKEAFVALRAAGVSKNAIQNSLGRYLCKHKEVLNNT
jgi:hypothetical protein